MKKGKLIKYGKKSWKIDSSEFRSGTMPISSNFGFTDDLNGKEVEFDNLGGTLKLVRVDGRDYRKIGGSQPVKNHKHSKPAGNSNSPSSGKNNPNPARAPYNFVPLNKQIVPSNGKTDHSIFEGLSGYINIEIETKTPIFIRGKDENFFSVDNETKIPGSSLRGMIRNIVEIATYSKFDLFENKRLYFRALAEPESELKNYYNIRKDRVEAGFLKYNTNYRTYSIFPCDTEPGRTVPTIEKFKYKRENNNWIVHSGSLGDIPKKQWVFPIVYQNNTRNEIKLENSDITDYQNDKMRDAKGPMADILKEAKKDKYPDGLPIFFSRYNDEEGKEHIAIGHTKYFRIPYHNTIKDHVIQQEIPSCDFPSTMFGDTDFSSKIFFEDAELSESVVNKISIPHILSSPKPTTFQHYIKQTNSYKTNRAEQFHWGTKNALIRGYKSYWHRKTDNDKIHNWRSLKTPIDIHVFKSYLKYKNEYRSIEEIVRKFNNFLEVEGKQILIKGDYHELPNELQIFLHELFFHEPQTAKKYNLKKPQTSPIKPLPIETQFKGRIRFENLTEEELGALLFVLDLPKGCFHKIGMGKPLGLGSVQITPHLTIIDRKDRYSNIDRKDRYSKLFDEKGKWHLSETNENEMASFKDAFAKYMGEQTSQNNIINAESYWEYDERMQALKEMLTFEHDMKGANVGWLERTRYQNRAEFINRPILPKPSEVIQMDLYRKR